MKSENPQTPRFRRGHSSVRWLMLANLTGGLLLGTGTSCGDEVRVAILQGILQFVTGSTAILFA